jgi:hypothetical protein
LRADTQSPFGQLILAAAVLLLLASPCAGADPSPAKKPAWSTGDNWHFEGSMLFITVKMSANVTGIGSIVSCGKSYSVYTVEVYSVYQWGALKVTIYGKDYHERSTLALVRSERSTVNGTSIRNTVTTYDPPRRSLDFPLELGKSWTENVAVTTEETLLTVVNRTTVTESVSYRVSGLEDVSTGAGTFQCYKVDATNDTNATLHCWYSTNAGNLVKEDIAPLWGITEVSLNEFKYKQATPVPAPADLTFLYITLSVLVLAVVTVGIAAFVLLRRRKTVQPQTAKPGAVPGAGPQQQLQPGPTIGTGQQQQPSQPAAIPTAQPASSQTAPQAAPAPPPAVIDDVFLIYGDGRLMHHDTRRLKPEVDDQILGSMFTAIQDFIGRSFPAPDGSRGKITEIRYAESRILVERGKDFYMAVATTMTDTALLQQRMARLVPLIEARCAKSLEKWDGNVESVSEAKRLSRLILTEEPIPDL